MCAHIRDQLRQSLGINEGFAAMASWSLQFGEWSGIWRITGIPFAFYTRSGFNLTGIGRSSQHVSLGAPGRPEFPAPGCER